MASLPGVPVKRQRTSPVSINRPGCWADLTSDWERPRKDASGLAWNTVRTALMVSGRCPPLANMSHSTGITWGSVGMVSWLPEMNAERVPSTPSSVPKNPSCSSTVASGPGLTGVWSTVKGSRTCTCTMRLPASTYSSGNATAPSTTGKVSAGCQGAVSGHTHTPRFCCSVPVTVRVPPSRVTATGSVVSTSARVTEMRLLLLGSVHSRSMRPRDNTVVVETSFDTGTT